MAKKQGNKITGTGLKVDLACGDNKREGFLGVDAFKTNSTDFVFDLLSFPWPIDDNSCSELSCSHFFEHIPAMLRPKFMEEAFRVLDKGGKFYVVSPHWSSSRSIGDFTHAWPPICEMSFLYFNKNWREMNKLTHGHYDINCDFDFTYGYSLDNDIQVRNQEYQQFAIKNYNNAVMDLFVTLVKR